MNSAPAPDTAPPALRGKLLMGVAWPAFLGACVLELLVFAIVDPQDLRWFGAGLVHTRQAVYTMAFIAFWLVGIGTSAMTALLSQPVADTPPSRAD